MVSIPYGVPTYTNIIKPKKIKSRLNLSYRIMTRQYLDQRTVGQLRITTYPNGKECNHNAQKQTIE